MKKRKTTQKRKQAKRKAAKPKVPNIFDGMWGGCPELGGFAFHQKGGDFEVEWQHCGKRKRVAMFSELCGEGKQVQRRDSGQLIADIMAHEAQRVMDSIGDPMESLNYTAPMRRMANAWRGWALAPAGDATDKAIKKRRKTKAKV